MTSYKFTLAGKSITVIGANYSEALAALVFEVGSEKEAALYTFTEAREISSSLLAQVQEILGQQFHCWLTLHGPMEGQIGACRIGAAQMGDDVIYIASAAAARRHINADRLCRGEIDAIPAE